MTNASRDAVRPALAGSAMWFVALLACALLACALLASACSSRGGGPASSGAGNGNAELVTVEYGRLVDVYGLRRTTDGVAVELFETDVVIGSDIQDERGQNSSRRDSEILFDFVASNPDNLQARLLITREIGTREFEEAFARLDDKLRPIAAGLFGQDIRQTPFTVVPRNAGIRLTFSADLGVDDSFFVTRDEHGKVAGLRNTEAVQLLQIAGDPRDASHAGDFRVVPIRIVPRGRTLILDPVLLGSEGLQYRVPNNAAGLPESPDQLGANVRIAIALEGPLRIPDVHAPIDSPYRGANNANQPSVVRDFRSGNRADDTPDIARGFVRDPEPPRIVGELLTILERVDRLNDESMVVTLYKNRREHEIDRGDVVRFMTRDGDLFGASEVLVDPDDDRGDPAEQHVRVIVRTVPGLESLDPSNDPRYPATVGTRETWLRTNAPRVVLVSEFTASRTHPVTGEPYGDDPSNFLAFAPGPLPLDDGEPSPPNQNISPFASAVVQFTKPVDMTTVRAFDTFFFATRDVLDDEVIRETFLLPRSMDPDRFDKDKFITPHLVGSRVVDEDGSQTAIRLETAQGFYLDQEMRDLDEGVPFESKRFRYFLHLLGGPTGIRDLSGNSLDFQSGTRVRDFLTIPFSLDTRARRDGRPLYGDNRTVSIVRRFASADEDEQPSLYRAGEFAVVGQPVPAEAFALPDLFGSATLLGGGKLLARPTTRVTRVVDDLNQAAPPPQSSDLRYCREADVAATTGGVKFGAPIQNPLNPYGARLQTVWREIDMSMSRVDPFDFNLDVEQMWWAPFTDAPVSYDLFDRVSLSLGHSEYRPEPCIGRVSALPTMPGSGVSVAFADNWLHNVGLDGTSIEDLAAPHPAYQDQQLVIDSALAITEPNGINRFLPLPDFVEPYFVWRDERVKAQGGDSGTGSDARFSATAAPYVLSPFLGGGGRYVTAGTGGDPQFNRGTWDNARNYNLVRTTVLDRSTNGLVGAIALPLLADFWTWCDDADLPVGGGFIATGYNGWQIALAAQSSPRPNFRAYSGGFAGAGTRPPICIGPSDAAWSVAAGGYTPTGAPTREKADNSVYWIMADFLKRQSVVTYGFVEVLNPHRMPARTPGTGDPRLGPYFVDGGGTPRLPGGTLPRYDWLLDPPIERLPGGTSVVPEFRAASRLDPAPWRWTVLNLGNARKPDAVNFPLDPLKAGDAHIRKFDERTVAGGPRNHWAFYYNRQVTDYTTRIQDLSDDRFTSRFDGGPREPFRAQDVEYFNWRFLMTNNVLAAPPVSPELESFAITWRFER